MTVLNTWDLTGRVALITGAGSPGGIGFATATAMATAGAKVAIADLASTDVKKIVADLPGGGHSAHIVDLTDADQTAKLVDAVTAKHGRLDAFVNAAAVLIVQPFLEVDPKSWARTLEVNTTGTFFIAQAVARYMVKHGGGQIVLIASNVGRVPRINNSSYAASKAAVIHLARCMAMELGPQGVSVNALCPGSTATSMLVANQAGGDPSRLDGIIKGSIAQWRTGIPLGRLAEPADQAALAVFLASAGGRYISGQAICVDGAQTYFG
jgi:2,3-dihydro-2,3-dihydroxybenzoate dehydrogenase